MTALDDLADSARSYANATRSANTVRAYESDWRHFEECCLLIGEPSLPATPRCVALYVTAMAQTLKPSTLGRRLAAISVAHQRAGYPTPTADPYVREVMKGIRRSAGTAPTEAKPLLIGDLRRVCARLDPTPQGLRDRAVLLVGFAGALRRSEIVALDLDDVTYRDEGAVLTLRRSKTDQEGEGRQVALPSGRDPETCPVVALEAWIAASGISEGPLFRGVNRHGRIAQQRLSAQSVTSIVRRAVESIGLDATGYSGHSLRAGFATTAAANGASERAIANQTGHRSMSVLRRYVRHGSLFTDNAVTSLGL